LADVSQAEQKVLLSQHGVSQELSTSTQSEEVASCDSALSQFSTNWSQPLSAQVHASIRSNGRDICVGCNKNTDVCCDVCVNYRCPCTCTPDQERHRRVCVDDVRRGVGLLEPEDVSKSLRVVLANRIRFSSLQVLECLEGRQPYCLLASGSAACRGALVSVRNTCRSPNTVRQYSRGRNSSVMVLTNLIHAATSSVKYSSLSPFDMMGSCMMTVLVRHTPREGWGRRRQRHQEDTRESVGSDESARIHEVLSRRYRQNCLARS
jgi:hypothetical protein